MLQRECNSSKVHLLSHCEDLTLVIIFNFMIRLSACLKIFLLVLRLKMYRACKSVQLVRIVDERHLAL